MTPILCTLFDRNYLNKALVMIQSLQAVARDFTLYVLALDEPTHDALTALYLKSQEQDHQRIVVIPYSQIETPELAAALADRTLAERCWTLTPYFTRLVLESFHPDHLAYIDADNYFFSSLAPLYQELDAHLSSVALIPHRFAPRHAKRLAGTGIYNVNFVYFRNDATGRAALDRWAEQTLGWCYYRTEYARDGSLRFGDQGYLDSFPQKYGAHIIQHSGANLAPWSQEQYEYCFEQGRLYVVKRRATLDQGDPGVVRIDPIIFFHFHGWTPPANRGGYTLRHEIIDHVYKPYEQHHARLAKYLARARNGARAGSRAARAR